MIKVKEKAPFFELRNQDNNIISLDAYKGQRLYMFFCEDVNELHTQTIMIGYMQVLQRMEDVNVKVIGIFGNDVKELKKQGDWLQVQYPMLYDKQHQVRKAFGVWNKKTTFGKEYWVTTRCGLLIDERGLVERVFKRIRSEDYAEPVITYLEHKFQKMAWQKLSRRTKERLRREASYLKSGYIGPVPTYTKKLD